MSRKSLITLALAVVLACSVAPIAMAADAPMVIQNVDTAKYPQVKATISLPPTMAGKRPTFSVAENGVGVEPVKAETLSSEAVPARVALVIDTSGSMGDGQLERAKQAAARFVDSLGQGSEVALIAFGDKPILVTGFTGDKAAVQNALASLQPQGETALYDALVLAASQFTGAGSAKASIVALSDGGDTVSNATFRKTIDSVAGAGVPLYAVAIKSAEYNPHALSTLAKRSGGRLVPVSRSGALEPLFEGIAQEISSSWTLSFKSGRPRTADIDLDITAKSGSAQAVGSTSYKNPALATAGTTALRFTQVPNDSPRLLGTIALAFLSISLLAVGLLLMAVRDRSVIEQLRFYDQLHDDAGEAAQAGGVDQVRSRVVDAVGVVAGKRGLTKLAADKLESAGLPLRPAEYMTGHILAVVGLGVLTQLLTGRMALSIIVVAGVTLGPLIALDIAADRRRARFEEQLPDVLGMIAGSLRGGWGIQQAIGLASQEAPEPSASELKRVETEARLGIPLERALENMGDRMGSREFRSVVTAVSIQREVGGNLAEVLDIVAKTIRERDAVKRQLRSLTAEGRLSAYILIGLPFGVFAFLLIVNPTYILPLVTTSAGLFILGVAVLMLIVGSIWMWRTTKIEV